MILTFFLSNGYIEEKQKQLSFGSVHFNSPILFLTSWFPCFATSFHKIFLKHIVMIPRVANFPAYVHTLRISALLKPSQILAHASLSISHAW